MYVGLVGSANDATIQHLARLIEGRGHAPFIVDSHLFPQETSISIAPWGPVANGVSLDQVRVWHVRAVYLSLPAFQMEDGEFALFKDWRATYIAGREQYAMMASWLRLLEQRGDRVVNPVESFDFHFLKPLHIESLRQRGFPVPQTLVSNNAEEVRYFVEAFPSVIYKPVAGGAYCREISAADMTPERLEQLRNAPVIFQERIAGTNVRAYVIGDRVVSAAAIHTQALDYRGNEEGFEAITLPSWVETMCVKAAHASKMPYAGIDLIKSPSGYVLLECNPTPVHLGMEQILDHPISDALVDYLIQQG